MRKLGIPVLFLMLFFNNCGQVRMVDSLSAEKGLSSMSNPQITFSDILLETTLNKSISKQMQYNVSQAIVSFSSTALMHEKDLLNAKVKIDPSTGVFHFKPNPGFRGSVAIQLFIQDGLLTSVQNITVKVDNPVLDFRPALAVRAPTCLFCHATVQGDMISDFGYKSAFDPGPDLFFAVTPNHPLDPPTGRATAYNVTLPWAPSERSTVYGNFLVPNVNMTSLDPNVARSFFPSMTSGTLVEHLTSKIPAVNPSFKGYVAKSQIYIGAPTESDIKTNSNLGSQGMKFVKNTSSDPELSGLSRVKVDADGFDYYTNTPGSPMICEGDLFVDGVVYLENLNLQTVYGCRIYATRSVFINGDISYSDVSALSNLQITSAIGVFMGMGACIDCQNDHGWGNGQVGIDQDSVPGRLIKIIGYLQQLRTMSAITIRDAIVSDYKKVTKILSSKPPAPGPGVDVLSYYRQYLTDRKIRLVDARNSLLSASVAKTSYSRLLVNAPIVMSRYTGNFQGLIIAEFAMWVPGQFSFNFDPVFTGVTLLPFLDFSKILKIEN